VGHPNDLMEIPQPEAEALLKASGTVVIPTGSVEQHGPHLPCGTDWYAALVFSRAAAERLGALVVPFAPMGITPFHMGFAGSLTLRHETFVAIMLDVAASVARHGARRLIILNWHKGNSDAIGVAASRIHSELGLEVIRVEACYVARDLVGAETGGLTHGGELEVLPVLALDPSLVHLERATNASPPGRGRRIDAVRRNPNVRPVLDDVRQIAPTGWYGAPEHATEEKARRVIDVVAERIAADVEEASAAMAELPDPPTSGADGVES
jgi:creatinine amidohydrolase